jgi:hypothetical protein
MIYSVREENKKASKLEINEERNSMSFNTFKDFIVRESHSHKTMSDTNSEPSSSYITLMKNTSTYKENYFNEK